MDEDFVLGTLGSDYRFEINVGFYKELEINIWNLEENLGQNTQI